MPVLQTLIFTKGVSVGKAVTSQRAGRRIGLSVELGWDSVKELLCFTMALCRGWLALSMMDSSSLRALFSATKVRDSALFTAQNQLSSPARRVALRLSS